MPGASPKQSLILTAKLQSIDCIFFSFSSLIYCKTFAYFVHFDDTWLSLTVLGLKTSSIMACDETINENIRVSHEILWQY